MTAARDTAARRRVADRRAERATDDAERLRGLVMKAFNAAQNARRALDHDDLARLAAHLDAAASACARARFRLMLAKADPDPFPGALR